MNQFPHDNIKPFEGNEEKKQQVSQMFNEIAPLYDFMNRFLSAGVDVGWRIKALREFKKDNPKYLLDVATGTGDMAIRACKMLSLEKVTGIDISENMLTYGRQKIAKEALENKIELQKGDSEHIQFADNSFDGVMVAFGVRNFQNLEKGLSEILRVLKPGKRVIVLEFSQPRIPGVRNLYNLYMGLVAPQIASMFRQNKKAYQYLNESAKAFPDRSRFVDILKNVGFIDTSFRPLSLGICCIYIGRKAI